MPLDLETLSDVIAMAVNDAVAPFKAQLAVAEAKLAELSGLHSSLTDLRERVVVAETKAAAVVPVDVSPFREQLAEMRSNLAALPQSIYAAYTEAKAAHVPTLPPPAVDSSDVDALRERVVAIETKTSILEARAAEPNPLAPVLERTERTVVELTKEMGAMRERLAVAEVRQLMPGPAGAPGKDGRDGVDGLGIDDLMVEQTDRSFTVKAVKGDRVKTIGTATFPVLIYRGVFAEGTEYEKGDLVTWGGSQWHCSEPTTTKPGENSSAWKLAVKRGRDGKDGKDAVMLPVVKVG